MMDFIVDMMGDSSSSSLAHLPVWQRVLLLSLLPVALPLQIIQNLLWYASSGGAQTVYAVKMENTDILMKNTAADILKAVFGLLTCPWRRLPDVHVLGAAKSGTTSLVEYMKQHRSVRGPWIAKETHFIQGRSFLRCSLELDRIFGWSWLNLDSLAYRAFFPTHMAEWFHRLKTSNYKGFVVMEGMPTLRFPEVASRIGHVKKGAKAVIVLRDPIDRAYSHYRMLKGHLPDFETRTFEEAMKEELDGEDDDPRERLETILQSACSRQKSLHPVHRVKSDHNKLSGSSVGLWYYDKRYSRASHYASLVPAFVEAFGGKGNVLVLGFSDLCNSPQKTANRVCTFLGISPFSEGELDAEPQHVGAADLKHKSARDMLQPETLRRLEVFLQSSIDYARTEFGLSL
jgi:hypothetical protein